MQTFIQPFKQLLLLVFIAHTSMIGIMIDTSVSDKLALSNVEHSLIALNDFFRKRKSYIKKHFKLTALEMELVLYIVNNGPKKMKVVAEHFNIKLSTLTSIIDKAERKKVLKRVNSKEDRRVVYLDATKKGNSIFDAYSQYLKELIDRMKGDLDEQNFALFAKSMENFTQLAFSNGEQ